MLNLTVADRGTAPAPTSPSASDAKAYTSVFVAPAHAARLSAARIFSALGHPTRLALLTKLADGQPRSIVTLAQDTKLSRQAIMKHLLTLEATGLIRSRRIGRERRFTLQPGPANEAGAYLAGLSQVWDQAERLKGWRGSN